MTKTFDSIPLERPETPLLDTINNPSEMRSLSSEQLLMLADELRSYLLFSVGQSGCHFGAGLGAVELTIALHYIFDTPEDKLVWDGTDLNIDGTLSIGSLPAGTVSGSAQLAADISGAADTTEIGRAHV